MPSGREEFPFQSITVECPLCGELRRYLPSEVFLGRADRLFTRQQRLNRTLVYLGACIIAGLRLAKERQVNIRVIPTRTAIEESVELAHEIFYQVFRKVPDHIEQN